MNRDQVKGTFKSVAGKVLQHKGKITGNKEQRIRGICKQIAGNTQKAYGDAKEVFRTSVKHLEALI